MKYIKEQNEFILENKITDFFKKFNINKIKKALKEELDIEENDSKKDIFIKLMKIAHDKSFEFIAKNFSTIMGGTLGALLGDLISYILTIFTDINTVEQLLLVLAGMIFMLYRSKTGIDKYGFARRSLTKDEPIKSPDYDELSDEDEVGDFHFISDFASEDKPLEVINYKADSSKPKYKVGDRTIFITTVGKGKNRVLKVIDNNMIIDGEPRWSEEYNTWIYPIRGKSNDTEEFLLRKYNGEKEGETYDNTTISKAPIS